jgi:ArsR family metal-binding transcriptional regulator
VPYVTTFPSLEDYSAAVEILTRRSLLFEVVGPAPAWTFVAAPGLVLGEQARIGLVEEGRGLICSGWVEVPGRAGGEESPVSPVVAAPLSSPSHVGDEDIPDVLGQMSVSVFAPCVADRSKVRAIILVSGDLTLVLPYLNAEMPTASYNPGGGTLTYMAGYRMISLSAQRITVAKAADLFDTWSVLADIREIVNRTWARRDRLTPSYERRRRPPALEIFKRLPGTNCKECSDRTCLAFADRLWRGDADPTECGPVFGEEYAHLRDALLDIARPSVSMWAARIRPQQELTGGVDSSIV